ncbi:cupin domain-containing protein [Desulforhopalus singaporensis]|uniref:Cupin domain-containing protein n=1 Tax=Desulforhopalus singaporensis TaxID=91360 RepID=A0A1H0J061_9BACT|nr:cupin domain-containing protein [Desulforhopalus singaporensis]SDO37124.1 Cupin domain-containing protein [Desulforhopalus singaporensis]
MIRLIDQPILIEVDGDRPKRIEEFVGRVNSDTSELSIARMRSVSGWSKPGQTHEFNEYIVVLKGMLQVETRAGVREVHPDQAIIVTKGEWVRYSTPGEEGAEYIVVCLPAFTASKVNLDE